MLLVNKTKIIIRRIGYLFFIIIKENDDTKHAMKHRIWAKVTSVDSTFKKKKMKYTFFFICTWM